MEDVAVGSGLKSSLPVLDGLLLGGPCRAIALSIVQGCELLHGKVAGLDGPVLVCSSTGTAEIWVLPLPLPHLDEWARWLLLPQLSQTIVAPVWPLGLDHLPLPLPLVCDRLPFPFTRRCESNSSGVKSIGQRIFPFPLPAPFPMVGCMR